MKIENLRKKAVTSKTNLSETSFETDDSNWNPAFKKDEVENGAEEDTAKIVVMRGIFTLPEYTDETGITLFTKSLGEWQDIYVNGQCLVKDIKRDATDQNYKLDHKILHAGINAYAIVVNPLKKRNPWEILNTDPGLVQVVIPAPSWRVKLFNGLAQIIVQSEEQGGEVTLTAKSEGLSPTNVKIQVIK